MRHLGGPEGDSPQVVLAASHLFQVKNRDISHPSQSGFTRGPSVIEFHLRNVDSTREIGCIGEPLGERRREPIGAVPTHRLPSDKVVSPGLGKRQLIAGQGGDFLTDELQIIPLWTISAYKLCWAAGMKTSKFRPST